MTRSVISAPDTGSGSVTLQMPSTNANRVVSFPDVDGEVILRGRAIQLGTPVNSTSGTAIDFTDIPSWAKKITVMFNGVSTNGTSDIQIRLGTSAGFDAAGYVGSGGYFVNAGASGVAVYTVGFGVFVTTPTSSFNGNIDLLLLDDSLNKWSCSYLLGRGDGVAVHSGGGSKTLSGTLDRIRITTVNGTDQFDAGSINIMVEG